MAPVDGVVLSAAVLGVVHGAEPGHGWPVAAAYALDRPNKWLHGLAASVILGVGHLISSVAVVAAYLLLQATGFSSPWWMPPLAGGILILLGLREIHGARSNGGHEHGHRHGGDHEEGHAQEEGHAVEEHAHDDEHTHEDRHDHAAPTPERGLLGLAGFAFTLGFVHEEEFQIIALCAGSDDCIPLMLVYAAAVLVGIVGLTLALVAGYYRFERRVERVVPYFPYVSGVVLIGMGVGFAAGLL